MYAVAVESYDKLGNFVPPVGVQALHYSCHNLWLRETEIMRNGTTGLVYVVLDFTQEMREMTSRELADYVSCNHIDVL